MSDSSDELTSGQAENPHDRLSEVEEQLEHVQRGAVLRTEVFGELKFVHSFVLQKWGFKSTSRAFDLCEHLHFPRSLHHYQRSDSVRISPPPSARLGRSLTTLRPWRKGESEARGASQSIWGLDRAMFFLQKSSHVSPHQMGKNDHLVVKWFFITLLLWICQRKRVGGNFGWLVIPNPARLLAGIFFHEFMNNLRKTWFKNMWPSWIGVCWWRIQWGF